MTVVTTKNNDLSRDCFLRVEGLSKKYGNVMALRDVGLEIPARGIVGLIGDNGAGKSTLLKCLSGTIAPDGGRIEIGGRSFAGLTPRESLSCGIAAVYQDLALVDELDAASNIFLGMEPLRLGFILDRGRMYREAVAVLDSLGIALPSVRVDAGRLSGGQRQAIAIARAVVRGSRSGGRGLILFDEPTAAMGVRESAAILGILSGLRERGYGLLCISHNIPQIFDLADRICVMRAGEVVWMGDKAATSVERVLSLLSGVRADV